MWAGSDDYSTTNIHLSYNNLTLFDYATFHPVLDTMTTGFVELFLNPFDCGCSVAWLVRDCRDLLVHVRYATCVNGTRFEDLNPLGFADCPGKAQFFSAQANRMIVLNIGHSNRNCVPFLLFQ